MSNSKVIFKCRFQKNPNDAIFKEIEDDLYLKSVMQNDFNIDKEREKLIQDIEPYDYGPLFFDLKDVAISNYVDPEHTHIRMYNSFSYTIKVPFDRYYEIYQTLTGVAINDFSNSEFETIEPDATNQ